MTHHVLKCWPEAFEATKAGEKMFDVRRNDRFYQKGDTVELRKYSPPSPGSVFTDGVYWNEPRLYFDVTFVLSGWGLQPEHVCLGLAPRQPVQAAS